jgi:solute carrier family 25 (mitochondrial S-adenosylmethionine transporter), member 26
MKHTVSVALPGGPQPLVHSLASGIAEMASCVVLAPAEVIKQNAQMLSRSSGPNASHQSTSLAALRQVTASGATKRLFTGYSALVARNLPFTAIQFPIFEYVRQKVWERRGGTSQAPGKLLVETGIVTGLSAASAGAFAAWITTPSDVVKTRMMLRAGEKQSARSSSVKGSLAVAQEVYRTRGIRGLFRGGVFRSAWTALGSGLYLGTYEMSKVWLTGGKEDETSF